MARYMRWLADEKGISTTATTTLWRWSMEDLEAFWASIWEFFDVRGDSGYGACSGTRDDAGRGVVPGRDGSPTPSTSSAARTTPRSAIHHASELRELDAMTWGELRAHDGGHRRRAARRAASGPATAWWPTCRTSRRPWPRSSPARRSAPCGRAARPDFGARSVVDRFAQIEPKVLLAVDGYRYNGKRLRPPRRGGGHRGRDRRRGGGGRVGYLTAAAGPSASRASEGAELEFEQAALRPPAVGALQLGHHRPAQGDRARRRAASCWSTSRSWACTWTPSTATACSGSPPPAG